MASPCHVWQCNGRAYEARERQNQLGPGANKTRCLGCRAWGHIVANCPEAKVRLSPNKHDTSRTVGYTVPACFRSLSVCFVTGMVLDAAGALGRYLSLVRTVDGYVPRGETHHCCYPSPALPLPVPPIVNAHPRLFLYVSHLADYC